MTDDTFKAALYRRLYPEDAEKAKRPAPSPSESSARSSPPPVKKPLGAIPEVTASSFFQQELILKEDQARLEALLNHEQETLSDEKQLCVSPGAALARIGPQTVRNKTRKEKKKRRKELKQAADQSLPSLTVRLEVPHNAASAAAVATSPESAPASPSLIASLKYASAIGPLRALRKEGPKDEITMFPLFVRTLLEALKADNDLAARSFNECDGHCMSLMVAIQPGIIPKEGLRVLYALRSSLLQLDYVHADEHYFRLSGGVAGWPVFAERERREVLRALKRLMSFFRLNIGSCSMAAVGAAGHKFLHTLVDRIAVQWDSDEIEIPAADFAKLLKRAVQTLPESNLRTELLTHLPVWQDDAWKRCAPLATVFLMSSRFNEKRRGTVPKAAKITAPADPNLFLASGRKQLLDKLASGKSADKRADYERLARAVLEPTELAVAKEIFDQMQSLATPAEQVDRILRFAVSQTASLRTALIVPFRVAADKLPPAQALQSCQRFLPLLAAAPDATSSSSDSLDSLAGLYLSLLSRTGLAEPSKLNTLRILLPSLSWLRAALAVSLPADPITPTGLDFIFRLYSLALYALPAAPSTVDYLRACIVCNRGAALAMQTRRTADEKELVRSLEKAVVPLTIAPLIPSLASAQTNAAQIYSTLVNMTDDKLLSALDLAEKAAVAAEPAQGNPEMLPEVGLYEDEEKEMEEGPEGDDALFFTDKKRSERIRTEVVREESASFASKKADPKANAAIADADDDAEEAELHAAIASSAMKLSSNSDVHKIVLSDEDGEEEPAQPKSASRKGPTAMEHDDGEEGEEDEEENENESEEEGSKAAELVSVQEKSATGGSAVKSKAPRSSRKKRREADVLQAELEALGISGGRNKVQKTGGRELRSGSKRSASR